MPPAGDVAHAQTCALTGNQAGNLSVLRLALNPLSPTSQGNPLSNTHILDGTELDYSRG